VITGQVGAGADDLGDGRLDPFRRAPGPGPVISLPAWYSAFVGMLIGGSVASFLGVVSERLPRRETLNGRSHCVCGRQLGAKENIPVLGWLLAGGTARCCSARIPVRYLLGEIAGVLGGAVAGWYGGVVGIVAGSLVAVLVVTVRALRRRADSVGDRSDSGDPGDSGAGEACGPVHGPSR